MPMTKFVVVAFGVVTSISGLKLAGCPEVVSVHTPPPLLTTVPSGLDKVVPIATLVNTSLSI